MDSTDFTHEGQFTCLLTFFCMKCRSTALICQSEQSHHEVHLVITVPELSAGSSGVDIFLFYAALRTSRLLLGSDLGFKIASKAPEQPLNDLVMKIDLSSSVSNQITFPSIVLQVHVPEQSHRWL